MSYGHRILLSDGEDFQADMSPRWVYMSDGTISHDAVHLYG